MNIDNPEYPWAELLNMEGLCIVSDGITLGVAYPCSLDEVDTIDPDGDCLYIQYVRGDVLMLLDHIDHPDGFNKIIFERNFNTADLKIYDYKRFTRRLRLRK